MKNTLLLIFILLISSCEKYVDLDIKELEPTIVVDAFVTAVNNSSVSYIKLTMSKGFDDFYGYYNRITDAQVTITDNQGNSILCSPDQEGIYRVPANLLPNTQYTLDIVKDQNHITATSITPEMITLSDFKKVMINGFLDLDLYFEDNPNQKDYYLIKAYESYNGGPFNNNRNRLVNDFNYNKQAHTLQIDMPFYNVNDNNISFKVELYHINKETYDYYNILDKLGRNDVYGGSFSTSIPGNPNTNTSNNIGHFATATMSSLTKNNLN